MVRASRVVLPYAEGQGANLRLLVYNLCIHRGDYPAALVEIDEFVKLYPAHPAVAKLLEKKQGLRQVVAAAPK